MSHTKLVVIYIYSAHVQKIVSGQSLALNVGGLHMIVFFFQPVGWTAFKQWVKKKNNDYPIHKVFPTGKMKIQWSVMTTIDSNTDLLEKNRQAS